MRKNLEKARKKMAPEMTPKMAPKPILKTPEQILSLLAQNQNMTVPDLMNKIGKSARTIKRVIKKLQQESRLKRIGPNKGGYWKVVKKNKK